MRISLFLAALILVFSLTLVVDCKETKTKEKGTKKPFKERIEFLRARVKRWHCHGPYGGGGGGGGGGFGGGGGGGGGRGMGMGGLFGGGGGLGDMDPTTLVLLALMSGAGGGGIGGGGLGGIGGGLGGGLGGGVVPLPPSVPLLKSPFSPEQAKSIDELTEELPSAPKSAASAPAVVVDAAQTRKATGHVAVGNRCAESSDCVANSECVEALRQKYCVCSHGRRPKGGLCV